MPTIANAPSGENTSLAGTEKIPLSGSKFAVLTTLRAWLKTYMDTLYATITHTHSAAVVQIVQTQTGAVATGTTIVPLDDTIPQNTEGTEFITLAITPQNGSNLLYIDAVIIVAYSTPAFAIAALFQDTTANALAASVVSVTTSEFNVEIHIHHKMTAGTTSSTTFKIRAGGHVAGTMTFNGRAAGRLFGGVMASSIKITEVES